VGLLDDVRQFPRGVAAFSETARVRATGNWDRDKLARLLAGLYALPGVTVIAEVDAAELGAADTPDRALLDYLETGLPPLWSSRWCGVRSMVLGGTLVGSAGILVSIVDRVDIDDSSGPGTSVVSISPDNPAHLQPVEWLAAGLRGDATTPGGVVLVVPPDLAGAAARAISAAGLRAEPGQSPKPAAPGQR
jgi:hypothetical protein